jgi:AcrR family transcriptional regulator
MPKLWSETVEAHRVAVREAALGAAAELIEAGHAPVTMSHIAQRAGIARATLYKYFPDIDAVLAAWHERQIAEHLQQLVRVRNEHADAADQLAAVLESYVLLSHGQHGGELARTLHGSDHIWRAQQQLSRFLEEIIADGAAAGQLRSDVPAAELAAFCLHASSAANALRDPAAIHRLIGVISTGVRPEPS